MPSAPPYFDFLIPARASGQAGPDVHLGYWDAPEAIPEPDDFQAAQARLTQRAIDLLPRRHGGSYLDVACGFGGTLAALAARLRPASLTGLNIDARQLHLSRQTMAQTGTAARFVAADACALPFADESFDHVLCIEAMFHFGSRAAFLSEAARVLRPRGFLVVTDMLLRPPTGLGEVALQYLIGIIRRDYGAWPEPWVGAGQIVAAAERHGLRLETSVDWSRATFPSYRTVAPPHTRHLENAGNLFWRLQKDGWLTYVAMAFRRREGLRHSRGECVQSAMQERISTDDTQK